MESDEKRLRAAVDADEKDGAARVALAKHLLDQGKRVEAAQACEDAARLFIERGKKDRAVGVFRRLLAIYKKMGRFDERVRVARTMLEVLPDDEHGEAHVALADAYADAGDTDGALKILHDEVRMLEAVAMLEVLGNRASIQDGAAWRRVVAALERITQLDRKDIPSRLSLARYQIHGKPAKALATLLEVLTLDRRNVAGLRLIDHAFLAVGQFEKAARTFEEVLAVDPHAFDSTALHRDDGADLVAGFHLIDGAVSGGALDDAFTAARTLLEKNPNRVPMRVKMFELYLRLGNTDSAMAELGKAIAIALEAGDADHARVLLQAGFRVAPWHGGLRESAVRVTEHLRIFPE